MRKINHLTSMEKEFAEEHHNVVYKFLNSNKLSEQEFYDVVIFGYLVAVKDYLNQENLQRYSFTTIAWRNMKNALAEEYLYRNRIKRTAAIVEYKEETTVNELDALLPGRMEALAEIMDHQKAIRQLLPCLTPKEKEVVYLKANGYTYNDIARHCNISFSGVNSRFHRLRKRLREDCTILEISL